MSSRGEAPPAGRGAGAWARWRWPLMIGGPLVILAIVAFFMLTGGKSQSTDDAYVPTAKAPISAAIAGRVIEVDVVENQQVKAGQVLFRLDPADELAAAHRADAALAAARLQVVGLRAAYDQQKLLLASALQTQAFSTREAARQQALQVAGVASRQQAAEARHTADLASAAAAVDRQQTAAALANLGDAANQADAYPAVLQAQASREAMRLNLAYTVVTAPVDGVVTRVDQLQKGAYVNAAQTLFYLLSGEPWIEANFKENQLGKMRIGQPAVISLDALGGRKFPGHVQSFSPGAGSSFSPLPAQNATGNWVKIVQRLPVRIAFDKAPPEVAGRAGLSAKVTVALMLATVMNSLDTTIANVALPHIQGSVSASADQITWVLTSYLIATAIMTPLSGWLSVRIGRKRLFMISIAGFTLASMLCGIATSLGEIVSFRLLQGLFGASLIPLSQAVVLDLYPPRQIGQVMALWGAAAILGPIFGPALGGWLTDNLTWRWVFYINLPIGILALAGVTLFMSGGGGSKARPFDFIGFGALTVLIAAFQLMVDRGPTLDWFSSTEIWTEAIVMLIAGWVFVVQTATAAQPFFHRALALDRNFVTCTIFGFFIGILLFSTMALLPPMMQTLMGYSALESGLVSMPRGLGSFAAMFIVGQLIGRVDTRLILFTGLSLSTVALWQMTRFDLDMGSTPIIVSGVIQGIGIGLIFVPLSTLAFATLAPEHRPEATGVYTLMRSLGASVGISIMQALWVMNTSVVHSSLVAHLQPNDPVVAAGLPPAFNMGTTAGLSALNGEVTRQAAMVGYVDDFRLMMIITLAVMPLLLVMRKPKLAAEATHAMAE